jgi:hypothetical protein
VVHHKSKIGAESGDEGANCRSVHTLFRPIMATRFIFRDKTPQSSVAIPMAGHHL